MVMEAVMMEIGAYMEGGDSTGCDPSDPNCGGGEIPDYSMVQQVFME